MNGKILALILLAISFLVSVPAYSADVSELERRIDMLSDELDRVKSSGGSGGGHSSTSLHGYGEMHIKAEDTNGAEIDNHRMVIGLHSELADWVHLNLEIDFEHAAQAIEMEFGYLDFLISREMNFRAGVMLMPMGNLNEFHEPPLFYTVERPYFHQYLIPSTWQQGGIGVFGELDEGINYRAYFVNALSSVDSNDDRKFDDVKFVRSGRAQLNQREAHDWALTGRLEYQKISGLDLGFSFYTGDSTQGRFDAGGNTTILVGDMKYSTGPYEAEASVMKGMVSDTKEINTWCAVNSECDADVPESAFGFLVQGAVHLPQLMKWKTTHDFVPFVMLEYIRPNDKLGDNYAPGKIDATANFHNITVGASYLPVPKVALKMDYQQFIYARNDSSKNVINLGVAYMY